MPNPTVKPEATISCAPQATRQRRRILCVFPSYSRSFGTFHHAYSMRGVRAFMPPQGMLVIAAYLPPEWEVRFVDENKAPAKDADYLWADAVFVSGMHIQRPQIQAIQARAKHFGKITVLGGPSVSGAPDTYPEFDVLHIGELGDATDLLIAFLEANERPEQQKVFRTEERLPLDRFPVPAYSLLDLNDYFLASIQFSSGCPYSCEFCDIPELYGRNPRLKTPQQVVAELDAMLERGNPGAIYFVDDNFVGNRKAAAALLPHLIEWQRRNGYSIEFACEATLNLAKSPELLAQMREASFRTVFVGIETPEAAALQAMSKQQNLAVPLLDSIRLLNQHGMEVVSGIILGLDTDSPDTEQHILEFIRQSQIPMLTINLLHALPRTPLWRRLEAEGRLVNDQDRESNVAFKMPYDQVVGMWRRIIAEVYQPEYLYERFKYNVRATYNHRFAPADGSGRITLKNVLLGFRILGSVILKAGVFSNYRRTFWKMALPLFRTGDVEEVIHIGLVAHHLIKFARECVQGDEAASFYAQHGRSAA